MALGKGLGAFFSDTSTKVAQQLHTADSENKLRAAVVEEGGGRLFATETVYHIPLSAIRSNPSQPRRNFPIEELQELVASIEQHGILQPIVVKEKSDGAYEIIAGERRFRAASMLGMTTIPSLVKKVDDNKSQLEMALIENIQRANLNPIEEAFAYKRLIDDFGETHDMVAQRIGKSRPHVSNMIRLLDLPHDVQRGLIEGKIPHTKARALLGLPTIRQQLKAYYDVISDTKYSTSETEAMVRSIRTTKGRRDPFFDEIERRLRERLGTKVFVVGSRQKGSVRIQFFSEEEFKRVLEFLEGKSY